MAFGHGSSGSAALLPSLASRTHCNMQWLGLTPDRNSEISRGCRLTQIATRCQIAKSPDFAPAYAALAGAYAGARHPRERLVIPDAEQQTLAMAEKAIQLDPLLAEAYGALGLVPTF